MWSGPKSGATTWHTPPSVLIPDACVDVSDLSPFFAIPPGEHIAANASAFAVTDTRSNVLGHVRVVEMMRSRSRSAETPRGI